MNTFISDKSNVNKKPDITNLLSYLKRLGDIWL